MTSILVTGGCGFIGTHLTRALVAAGANVTVLDNLSNGAPGNVPPGARLVVGDVRDAGLLRGLVQAADGVFHLAAVASVEVCNQRWHESHTTNLGGTLAVFEAARDHGRPVVWASSAAVYGSQVRMPLEESLAPAPTSPYGADKLGGEVQAGLARRMFGLRAVGMRFFNVYGPGQDPASPYSGVASIFIRKALQGQVATINGDGGAVRDFIYVSDVVDALARAMEAMRDDVGASRAPVAVNVCTGVPTSVLELHRTIGEVVGSHLPPAFGPERLGDIRASLGSTALLDEWLAPSRRTALSEGLRETIEAIRAGDSRIGGEVPR